jgi:YD repeat-containing protein
MKRPRAPSPTVPRCPRWPRWPPRALLAIAVLLSAPAAWSAACSYPNFAIGFEISARQGPDSTGKYLFAVSPLRCNAGGSVIHDSGLGFSDGYEMGWYTPTAIRETLQKSFLYNLKAFEGWCRLHYVGIHRAYHGTVAGINADAYPVQPTPHLGVFPSPLHLPLGDTPQTYLRDAVAEPDSNLCHLPAQIKEAQSCIGNPIVPGQGCKRQQETDYRAAGTSPLDFIRHYDSQNPYHDLSAPPRPLGNRWRHNHEVSLNPSVPGLVVVQREDGQIHHYRQSGNGPWTADADLVGELSQTGQGWTWHGPDDARETFDRSGRRLSRTLADGRRLSYTYDATGRLSEVRDPADRRLQLTYDPDGRLSTLTDPAGQTTTYRYDPDGSLDTVRYPDHSERRYTYTQVTVAGQRQPALLTGLIDENATSYATWTYDANARATSSEHAGGVDRHQITYQTSGDQITGVTLTHPLNAVSQHSYQAILGVNKVSRSSHPLLPGLSQTYTYDANGNLSRRTDFNGRLDTYQHDPSRNLETRRNEASGQAEMRTVSTQWHATWRRPVQRAEPNRLSTWAYHGDTLAGSPVSCAPDPQPLALVCQQTEQATTDADGSSGFNATLTGQPRTWTYRYNEQGQILSADGPRIDVADLTTYRYYDLDDPDPGKRGQLASITNALGQRTEITAYNEHGRPLTLINANGSVTTLGYDLRQRLTSRSVDSEITTITYDPAGQVTRITHPDGSHLEYTRDPAHRLIALSDSLGNQIRYTLDAQGNRLRETINDPAGQLAQTRQRLYDNLGRLAQDIGARSQVTAYEHDAQGNRSRITDPLNQQTVLAYDALDRLRQVTDAAAGQTHYQYDGQDRLRRVTDPRNLATTYSIDGLGNRTQQHSPDSGLTSSRHDAAGNEISRTDAKGQTTTLDYDALNRLSRIRYADGRRSDVLWDQGANASGRLSRIDDRQNDQLISRLENTYDPQGRLIRQTRSVGQASHTLAWTWSAGRLTGATTASGRRLAYRHDGNGRLSEIHLTDSAPGGDGRTRLIASEISYHPFGGVHSYRDGAGQKHTRNQDQDGRPSSYTLGSDHWLLSHDAAGRLSAQFDAAQAADSATYGYDSLDRLTSANLPHTRYGYTWDATGNRLSHTLGGTTRPYTLDPASNRLQRVDSTPPKHYRWDANGSLVSDGASDFAYDAQGRLAQATTAAGITRYDYNGLGERVRKIGVTDTVYVYDPDGRLVAESTADGTVQREYLWLEDLPVAVLQ